jgi:hypothetical protein
MKPDQPAVTKTDQILLEIRQELCAQLQALCPPLPFKPAGKLRSMKKSDERSDLRKLHMVPADVLDFYVAAGPHAKFAEDRGRLFTFHIGVGCERVEDRPRYLPIFLAVANARPGFFVVKPGDNVPCLDYRPWSYLNIFKRYYTKEHPAIDPSLVARDLIWLMHEFVKRPL